MFGLGKKKKRTIKVTRTADNKLKVVDSATEVEDEEVLVEVVDAETPPTTEKPPKKEDPEDEEVEILDEYEEADDMEPKDEDDPDKDKKKKAGDALAEAEKAIAALPKGKARDAAVTALREVKDAAGDLITPGTNVTDGLTNRQNEKPKRRNTNDAIVNIGKNIMAKMNPHTPKESKGE